MKAQYIRDEDSEYLEYEQWYEVGYIEVNNSYSWVYLKGINGSFNSTWFIFDEMVNYEKLFEEQRVNWK